jgi:Arc/MetJ family transcription regulator
VYNHTHQREARKMRTNIDIDDKLIKEAFKLSESTTKKELIHELELYIKLKQRADLKELKGKISFAKDYDHKKLRVG